jgi:hypothetical protein
MANQPNQPETRMDDRDLYREEIITDRKIGSIQRLTPLTADGEPDSSRAVLYIGQAQVYTPAGPLPLSFELEADGLREAIEKFGPAAEKAVEDTMKKLQEMRREAASSIVVPGADGAMGGMPGGGKIQLR